VGGDPCNVWWKVPSSATLGTNTSLTGSILALTSISMNTGATLNGRALARNGAVTLDQNTITNTECATPNSTGPTVTVVLPATTSSSATTPGLPNTGTGPVSKNNNLAATILAITGLVLLLSSLIRKSKV
jgi:hypothetical protein